MYSLNTYFIFFASIGLYRFIRDRVAGNDYLHNIRTKLLILQTKHYSTHIIALE